jgi:hypothetical protein
MAGYLVHLIPESAPPVPCRTWTDVCMFLNKHLKSSEERKKLFIMTAESQSQCDKKGTTCIQVYLNEEGESVQWLHVSTVTAYATYKPLSPTE